MKICLFSPYIPDHFGGGEKFLFDVALSLVNEHEVVVAVAQKTPLSTQAASQLRDKYEQFLGKSLEGVSFVSTPIWTDASFFRRLLWTKQFNVLFFATDGSLFFSLAKRNILHIQVPFTTPMSSPIDRVKLANWQVKTANSQFTQKIVSQHWRCKIPFVHYPQIDVEQLQISGTQIKKREKVILHVGRFFKQLHSKRQDVLVDIFRQLRQQHAQFADWKLVFIGAVEDEAYFAQVKKSAAGLPVFFYPTISRSEVVSWYRRASVYWHATGYQVDAVAHPEKVEHFGISTVEAMASGCVPLVYNAGGQQEILSGELDFCLWNTPDECARKTQELMNDGTMYAAMQQRVIARSQDFGPQRFKTTLREMLGDA